MDKHLTAKKNLFEKLIEITQKSIDAITEKLDLFDDDDWTKREVTKVLANKTDEIMDLKGCLSDIEWQINDEKVEARK